MNNIKVQNLLREYLKYFQWFLDKEIGLEELDYMLHLRDRIEEAHCDLGDLDSVLRMNAKQIIKYKSLFDQPMSRHWWWNRSEWENLARKQAHKQLQKRARSRRIPVGV